MNKPTPNSTDNAYNLQSVTLPAMRGGLLRLAVGLLEGPLGFLIRPTVLKNAGVLAFRGQDFPEPPTYQGLHPVERKAQPAARASLEIIERYSSSETPGFDRPGILAYRAAYQAGTLDPAEVAEGFLAAVNDSQQADPPLNCFIAVDPEDVRQQAEAAARRYRQGNPLSPLDGVPIAIKDEVDLHPYPTTVGTAFLGNEPAAADSTVAARLRAAGALLVGKTHMHEIGIGVTGLNRHHETPRNPYAPGRFTGGSSSGSAAAVSAGLVPAAIGADGGGSIRIPAALCGVVGLKATYGRISEHGAAPLCWSVAHLGPLAARAVDAALVYGVIAGPDPADPNSLHQPEPTLSGWDDPGLAGLKIGVYWPWFRHAADPLPAICEGLLGNFEGMGAEVQAVTIPELEQGRVAHMITIATEMAQALSDTYPVHYREHGLDVRFNLAMAHQITALDYIKAQRVRTRMIAHFTRAFETVDVIVMPATAIPAPPILDAALKGGESDLATLAELMRYVTPPNITGFPSIVFPAGYTDNGLPVSMQAIGRAWQEPVLLRLAQAAEQVVSLRRPERYHLPVEL